MNQFERVIESGLRENFQLLLSIAVHDDNCQISLWLSHDSKDFYTQIDILKGIFDIV